MHFGRHLGDDETPLRPTCHRRPDPVGGSGRGRVPSDVLDRLVLRDCCDSEQLDIPVLQSDENCSGLTALGIAVRMILFKMTPLSS